MEVCNGFAVAFAAACTDLLKKAPMKVKDQVQQLLAALNVGIQEKEPAMAMALLAAVAGESIFLLGAPGVAKSLLARRLKFAFKDGKAFEYLMNRFSTPDEIFGPVAISKLKEDQYVRIVDDYLPGATVVFLDEIWKAGPSIQNALLTVLNEKVYRNGAQEVKLPLKAILSASNELPAEGEGLDALWDRFLIRLKVEGVQDKKAFNTMISSTANPYTDNIDPKLKISADQYEAWGKGIDAVKVPDHVFQVIHMVRAYLQEHNKTQATGDKSFYVSDRRWRKLIRLLRTSAFLNGRDAVDLMDAFLILHCIWDEEGQIPVVQRFVKDAIEKHGYQLKLNLKDIEAELKDLNDEVLEETSFLKPIQKERLKVYLNEYYRIPELGSRYIKTKQYDALVANDFQHIELFTAHSNTLHRDQHFDLKKGNVKNSLVARQHYTYTQGTQYNLEVESYNEQVKATRKPHPSTQKHFDAEVRKTKTTIANLLEELNSYRKKDLQHLRVNLFVDASLADVVENNLKLLEKQLQKLDIEADRIKKYYETVPDQSK
jgi:MoxR-like ATPase